MADLPGIAPTNRRHTASKWSFNHEYINQLLPTG